MLRKNWHVCVLVTLACSAGCSGDDGPGVPIGTGGSTGGEPSSTGGSTTGGNATVTGGNASTTGGTLATGGSNSGGTPNTGGASGAANTGGTPSSGGVSSGGANTGGASSGGKGGSTNMNTGGSNSGGKASSGGSNTGGSATGGKGNTGGNTTGGKGNTGGNTTGGKANTGGSATGGSSTGGTAGGSTCPEVNTQLCGMTAQHNTARANVSPAPATPLPEMSWDTTVAAAAQAWADQCMFSHNAGSYGQNLYASTGSNPPSPKAVVDSWVSEVADYNYANNSCSDVCGHYTQVVWRNSTKVGCGIKTCTSNSPFGGSGTWYIVVCNYSPPGNFSNQKPY